MVQRIIWNKTVFVIDQLEVVVHQKDLLITGGNIGIYVVPDANGNKKFASTQLVL